VELGSKENSIQKVTSLLLRNRRSEIENEHGVTCLVMEQCKLKTGSVYCFVTEERILVSIPCIIEYILRRYIGLYHTFRGEFFLNSFICLSSSFTLFIYIFIGFTFLLLITNVT
jgi:hypothetical protein